MMDHRVSFGGDVNYEYLILGAGPAGLQMGHHLSRAGHSYLILEAGDGPGTSFKKFPRHRALISDKFTDPELNLPPADEMVRYLSDYAGLYGLNLRCDTRILRIEKPRASQFRLTDAGGNVFSCRRLIVATGAALPYVPAIPGIGLAENYVDVSVDPEDFVNQRVLVLGTGSSGFETADNLIATAALVHVAGPHPLELAGKARHAVLDCAVEKIERREGQLAVSVRYSHVHGETGELVYDRVIVATGFRFDDSIFAPECRPELVHDDRLPAQTPEWESVNVPGLYFAGALTQANGFEKSASGFIHGFRYNLRALFRMLEKKHHRRPWPSRELEPTPEGLVEATLARVNRACALWRQPGFHHDVIDHDVIVVDEGWDGARYYEEMPLAYIQQSEIGEHSHYYTITLEFGEGDAFAFLHPVIRRWSGRQLVSEKHLQEDLFGAWKAEDHVAPLRYFFMQQLLESVDLEHAVAPQRMLRVV
jgi:thioredoxin reductase